jgi:hypothetical protein
VLSLYAKGLATGEISARFAESYGVSASNETIHPAAPEAPNLFRSLRLRIPPSMHTDKREAHPGDRPCHLRPDGARGCLHPVRASNLKEGLAG